MMLSCVDKCKHGSCFLLASLKTTPKQMPQYSLAAGTVRCQGLHLLLFHVRSGSLVVPAHQEMAHTWCLSRGTWLERHQAQGGRKQFAIMVLVHHPGAKGQQKIWWSYKVKDIKGDEVLLTTEVLTGRGPQPDLPPEPSLDFAWERASLNSPEQIRGQWKC